MMHGCASGKGGVVVYVDMATKKGGIRHDHPTAHPAVVRDMSTGHEITVAADGCQPLFFFRATINGYSFAKNIVIADLDTSVASLVAQVLGCRSDYHAREKLIVFSYGDPSGERDVVH